MHNKFDKLSTDVVPDPDLSGHRLVFYNAKGKSNHTPTALGCHGEQLDILKHLH